MSPKHTRVGPPEFLPPSTTMRIVVPAHPPRLRDWAAGDVRATEHRIVDFVVDGESNIAGNNSHYSRSVLLRFVKSHVGRDSHIYVGISDASVIGRAGVDAIRNPDWPVGPYSILRPEAFDELFLRTTFMIKPEELLGIILRLTESDSPEYIRIGRNSL